MPQKWKSAWITGASSGIGKNLAIELAKKDVKVFASARRKDRLSEISKMSENIIPLVMDVTDEKKLTEDTKNLYRGHKQTSRFSNTQCWYKQIIHVR